MPEPRAGEPETDGSAALRFFPCPQCGAELSYAPGTTSLACGHCGSTHEIPDAPELVAEEDYLGVLATLAETAATVERLVVACDSCGARTTLGPNVTAAHCVFCGAPVVASERSERALRPWGVLPFRVERRAAEEAFRAWVRSRWFAPSSLKREAQLDGRLVGIYLPYWTYDSDVTTRYTGWRGEDYWDTETYTTVVNGKTVRRTRRVRRTRWYPAGGTVFDRFDDVLVPAADHLPRERLHALEPWDLPAVVPYEDAYLAGFRAESYAIALEPGFEHAKMRMDPVVRSTICRDIGGDRQRIDSMASRYDAITFKHLLLPVWLFAYRHRGRTYQVLVNARTAEVQGDRPWSAWKIAAAVAIGLAVAGAIAAVAALSGR